MKIKRNSKGIRISSFSYWLNIRILTMILFTAAGLRTYGQITLSSPNTTGVYKAPFSITLSNGFSANGANGVFMAGIEQSYLSQGSPANFTSTWVPRAAITTTSSLKAQENNSNNVNITTTFMDGLSRVVQQVDKNQTINNTDFVLPYEYDDLSRQTKQYLPYAYSGTGAYHVNALATEQSSFYNSGSTINPQSNNPSSKTILDNSPLERTLEQGSPGDSWQLTGSTAPNSGHTFKFDYTGNNITAITDINNTRIAVAYGVAIDVNGVSGLTVYGTNGYYDANDLYVKVIKDENWVVADGRNGTQEIYTDKNGNVVLKRSFVKNQAGTIDILSSYFVYDDFGNLCYVLPPASSPDVLSASNGVNISSTILNTVCYQYQYDERQRQVAKRTPGKDWEYFVYNTLNQLVASQDGNQRTRNEWAVKKYDGLGRTIITGVWNNNNTAIIQRDLQAVLNQQTKLYETKIATGTGYSSTAWPQNINSFYTINYFDDYNIPGVPAGYGYQSYAGNPDGYSNQSQGLPTISKTWPLSNSTVNLWNFSYYDKKGKLIQLQSTNHLSGKDIYNTEYSFTGQITKSAHQHSTSTGSVTIVNRFVYDHHGRELQHYEQLGNDPEVLMSQLVYNDLGQIVDKKLHQKNGNSKFIQSIDYRYNIHGTLLSVNDPSLTANSATNPDDANTSDADKFGMILKYDQAEQPQFNKNIGSLQWAVAAPTGISMAAPIFKYDYTYDKLNRLIKAASSTGSTKDENFSEYLSYDKMGNILSLNRWAKLAAGKTLIDNLSYLYTSGNQVNQIDDASNNNTYGFKDNGGGSISKQANEYTYDLNGNLTKDLNKGITSITYNSLDLPEKVAWSDGKTLVYGYDGKGNKLNKVYTVGSNVYTTDYIDEMQYEQGQIAFLTTDEGIARKNTAGNNYIYQYFLKDQVGNTHAVIQPVYPAETLADLVQVTNYYPFGLDYKSDDPATLFGYVSGPKNKYLFNGKELQDGTEMYDFGARNYDPTVGRWNAPDAASQFLNESPYAALKNNPIIVTDPDGNWAGLDDAVALIGGGLVNVVSNAIQGNIHSFGSAFSYFGIGALAGEASLYGGPMAGGAVMGLGNSVVTQGFSNGWGHIDGGKAVLSSVLGAGTSMAGAELADAIAPFASNLTSSIASPVLKGALTQAATGAATGFTLTTAGSLIQGRNLWDAVGDGVGGAVDGGASGFIGGGASGIRYAKVNELGLWSGRSTAAPLPPALSAQGVISTSIRYLKQLNEHTINGKDLKSNSYLNSTTEAQNVVDAAHNGSAKILHINPGQNRVYVEYKGITGIYNNNGVLTPTNKFLIKGIKSSSVVPIHQGTTTYK